MSSCCVVGCVNRGKDKPELKFFNFPGRAFEADRKKRWLAAIRRMNPDGTEWVPYNNAKVCGEHFVGGKPSNIQSHPAYVPSIFPEPYKKQRQNVSSALARFQRTAKRRFAKKEPSDQPSEPDIPSTSESATDSITSTSVVPTSSVQTQVSFGCLEDSSFQFYSTCEVDGYNTYCNIPQPLVAQKKDSSCGTENDLQVCGGGFHGFTSIREKEDLLKYLTTTTITTFSYVLSLLPNKSSFRSLSDEDALLLFLMKMKLGLSFGCLGVLFNVHRSTAMRIFLTLLETINIRTKDLIFWPSKQTVQSTLPMSFKEKYKDTRVIIDCTEMKTEMPAKVEERIYMYSHYKSAYTFKFLIGITPNGFISFKSKCYGGRCSDSQITNDCGLLALLEKGDVVLADKGFPGVNTCDPETIIVMPPMLRDGRHTAEEVARTQSIAGVRIHVERAIQRVKIFLILRFIPHDLFKYIDQIVHVACVLANLLPPMFKDDEA